MDKDTADKQISSELVEDGDKDFPSDEVVDEDRGDKDIITDGLFDWD